MRKEMGVKMGETRIVMLGTRGSMPVNGERYARYGGASTCVLVQMAGEAILLDAGTGILSASEYFGDVRRLTILLSHPHADHIQGLAMFAPMFDSRCVVEVYADTHMGYTPRQQIELFMTPPLWPCTTDVFQPGARLETLPRGEMAIGAVRMDWIEGNHPGGCTIYRLKHKQQTIVYCTDFEHGEKHTPRLIEFAKGCDVLIYDAQYSPTEYRTRRGFGHSTWEEGGRIGELCGAGRVILTHHAPDRTDEQLDRIQADLRTRYPKCSFARSDEEVRL